MPWLAAGPHSINGYIRKADSGGSAPGSDVMDMANSPTWFSTLSSIPEFQSLTTVSIRRVSIAKSRGGSHGGSRIHNRYYH